MTASTQTESTATEFSKEESKEQWQLDIEQNPDLVQFTKDQFGKTLDLDNHFVHSITEVEEKYEDFSFYVPTNIAREDHMNMKTFAIVKFGKKMAGYKKIVHGGCIATIIDECGGWTFGRTSLDIGATVNLNVNYRSPLFVGTTALVKSQISKVEGRKVTLKISVENGATGQVYSDAEILYVLMKKSKSELTN